MRGPRPVHGFTLVEVLIGMGIFLLASGFVLKISNLGMTLYGKNLAVNVSHQEARNALDRIVRDLNDAISTPTLVGTSLQPVADPTDWAPGVSFLRQGSPVLRVNKDAAANQKVIRITTGGYVPKVNQRLIIPSYQVENNITAVSSPGGGLHDLTLATNLTAPISASGSVNVVVFIADVVAYTVNTGELRYYPSTASPSNYNVVARNMTNATPFGVPTY